MSTTEEKEFRINIDTLLPEFNDHLNIHQNSRIFLSGQFGIGKTYFLKEFFANREKCEVFHLSPVQYQISSNEDIINFLKYDILIELINKGNVFDNKSDLDKSFIAFIKKGRNSNSFIK